MSIDQLLEECERELMYRSRAEIAAYKWASRAVSTYRIWENGRRADVEWLRDARDYFCEAVECASLADREGATLRGVVNWIHKHVPRGVFER